MDRLFHVANATGHIVFTGDTAVGAFAYATAKAQSAYEQFDVLDTGPFKDGAWTDRWLIATVRPPLALA